VEKFMSNRQDGQGPDEEKENAIQSKDEQRPGDHGTEVPLNALENPALSESVPVFAEGGKARAIEGGEGTAQILPFETVVQGHIGRQLRALYDDVLAQPIPDRFLDLLRKLDETSDPGAVPGDEG
jgi:hypothetical protein